MYAQADPSQVLDVQDKNHLEHIVNELENQIGLKHAGINASYNNECLTVLDLARGNFFPASDPEGRMRREQFVTIQGILITADWLASSQEAGRMQIPPLNFQQFPFQPYDYQTEAGRHRQSIFITLPTGKGKTEAALYWALLA